MPIMSNKKLNLSGNEALIYSYFYAATQNNKSTDTAAWVKGSFQFFEALLNISRRSVIRCINRLCEKELLQKRNYAVNNGEKITNLYAAVVPKGIFANGFEAGINPQDMAIPISYQSASETGKITDTTDQPIPENSVENSIDGPTDQPLENVENSSILPPNGKTAGQPLVTKCHYPWCQNVTTPSDKMSLPNINKYKNNNKIIHPTKRTTDGCQVDNPNSESSPYSNKISPTPKTERSVEGEQSVGSDVACNSDQAHAKLVAETLASRTDGRMDSEVEEIHEACAEPHEGSKFGRMDGQSDSEEVVLDAASEADFALLCAVAKNRNKLERAEGIAETKRAFAALVGQGFASWEIAHAFVEKQKSVDRDTCYSPQLCRWLNDCAAKEIERSRYKWRNLGLRARFRRYFDTIRVLGSENSISLLTFDERYPNGDSEKLVDTSSAQESAEDAGQEDKNNATESGKRPVPLQEFLEQKIQNGESLSAFEKLYAKRYGVAQTSEQVALDSDSGSSSGRGSGEKSSRSGAVVSERLSPDEQKPKVITPVI